MTKHLNADFTSPREWWDQPQFSLGWKHDKFGFSYEDKCFFFLLYISSPFFSLYSSIVPQNFSDYCFSPPPPLHILKRISTLCLVFSQSTSQWLFFVLLSTFSFFPIVIEKFKSFNCFFQSNFNMMIIISIFLNLTFYGQIFPLQFFKVNSQALMCDSEMSFEVVICDSNDETMIIMENFSLILPFMKLFQRQ